MQSTVLGQQRLVVVVLGHDVVDGQMHQTQQQRFATAWALWDEPLSEKLYGEGGHQLRQCLMNYLTHRLCVQLHGDRAGGREAQAGTVDVDADHLVKESGILLAQHEKQGTAAQDFVFRERELLRFVIVDRPVCLIQRLDIGTIQLCWGGGIGGSVVALAGGSAAAVGGCIVFSGRRALITRGVRFRFGFRRNHRRNEALNGMNSKGTQLLAKSGVQETCGHCPRGDVTNR
mmetsp:Transcript_7711/g.19477  ORF Transcript_7711/g.19477 Transcript_7711/m.19477 type:complete len:231 (+) Transcript_7711:859-1551(+)